MNSMFIELVRSQINGKAMTQQLNSNGQIIEKDLYEIVYKLRNFVNQMLPANEQIGEEEFQKVLDWARASLSISYEDGEIIQEKNQEKWFENFYKDLDTVTRWDRYKDYLKSIKNFPPTVLQGMEKSLFKMTELLGNPNNDNSFDRKGLVVGDVQSGKTANYVGLMNLAMDVGYKLIIVLTGTTNTLREQTQIRIEEGLGVNKGKGVSQLRDAEYRILKNPNYLTSRDQDFSVNSKQNFQCSIDSTDKTSWIIVTKKNVTSLENIYKWLEKYSKPVGNKKIEAPVLLIDDEADFASVNTNIEGENPTKINKKIREILNLFRKNSYIGFTATPFANIFINPTTEDDMLGQDLFPKDYIYVLGESSDYIGIQKIFSEDDKIAKYRDMLIELNEGEVEEYIPLKHKKTFIFEELTPSMVDAINLFFIANVIRDMRGDETAHRSMLLNISRFMDIHELAKVVVTEYVDSVKRDIRLYGKLPLNEALEHSNILGIKRSFEKYYSSLSDEYSFEEILHQMNNSIYRIKVAIVNSSNKDVDYLENEFDGERVIVIGGFALSRGLTLEGLIISYYWRNSIMYDSLLQMGRWFGYRKGYDDLCKVFMSRSVIEDFSFIALATQELKEDLAEKSNKNMTPKQFGIRIRSGQVGLIITARNKMQTGKNIVAKVDLNKEIVETTTFSLKDNTINENNRELIRDFLDKHKQYPNIIGRFKGFADIPKEDIIEFLDNYKSISGSHFDNGLITDWLERNDSPLLEKWDVGVVSEGKSVDGYFDYGNGFEGKASKRRVRSLRDVDGGVRVSKSRLGSPSDGATGLTKEQIELIKQNYQSDKTIPQKEYFSNYLNRKPLLMIYSIDPEIKEDTDPLYDVAKDTKDTIPLVSLGIPELHFGESKRVEYTVNQIYASDDIVEDGSDEINEE